MEPLCGSMEGDLCSESCLQVRGRNSIAATVITRKSYTIELFRLIADLLSRWLVLYEEKQQCTANIP